MDVADLSKRSHIRCLRLQSIQGREARTMKAASITCFIL